MRAASYQQLALAPLGPEAISELLEDLLGTAPSCVGLGSLIRQRTGGNPFFIEEVVQSLLDHGVLVRTAHAGGHGRAAVELRQPITEIEIPPTVHLERAELARVTGDEATHERERRTAHQLLVAMGATVQAERLAKEISLPLATTSRAASKTA